MENISMHEAKVRKLTWIDVCRPVSIIHMSLYIAMSNIFSFVGCGEKERESSRVTEQSDKFTRNGDGRGESASCLLQISTCPQKELGTILVSLQAEVL